MQYLILKRMKLKNWQYNEVELINNKLDKLYNIKYDILIKKNQQEIRFMRGFYEIHKICTEHAQKMYDGNVSLPEKDFWEDIQEILKKLIVEFNKTSILQQGITFAKDSF